jgi:hypothetical protein
LTPSSGLTRARDLVRRTEMGSPTTELAGTAPARRDAW